MTLAPLGCGSDGFVPPPPPELREATGGSPTVGASTAAAAPGLTGATARSNTIDLILSGLADSEEAEAEKSAARQQGGLERAPVRFWPADEGPASPSKKGATHRDQAKLLRDLLEKHPRVVIVEPADPQDRELARAIQETRAAKVPVILLGRPLAVLPDGGSASPGAPMILVAPPSFRESARQIVAAAIRNAKNAKLKPEGGAILMINTAGDVLMEDRVSAMRDALKSAGIAAVDLIRFARDSQAGSKILSARLKADSNPAMVFFFDSVSGAASNNVVSTIAQERPFIQAGYTGDDGLLRMVTVGEYAALAVYMPSRLLRKAVATAALVAAGRELPSRVELALEVHESPEKTGAPVMQAQYRASKKGQSN
jgi:hypothetical protein